MYKKFWKQYSYPLVFSTLVILGLGIFLNARSPDDFFAKKVSDSDSLSVVAPTVGNDEAGCNSGDFDKGTTGDVKFCKGESWELPSTIQRSSEGRLLVVMSPLDETGAAIYNSSDWHGYEISATWSKLEGDLGCGDDGDTCSFKTEPTVSDYLKRDHDAESDNDGLVYQYFAKSLYFTTEIPCVTQCWENVGESICGSSQTCCENDSDFWENIYSNRKVSTYGRCNKGADALDAFQETASTHFEIGNTSAGHNGSYSPNWPGQVEDRVPTIFEAFETWCESTTGSDVGCRLDNVKSAYQTYCDEKGDCPGTTGYQDIYNNFDVIPMNMGIDGDGQSYKIYEYEADDLQGKWINQFLTQRREYAAGPSGYYGTIYDSFDSNYMIYRCRFHQRLLAVINKYMENYPTPFSMYLNSESGNTATLPNTIKTIDEIDDWAKTLVQDAVAISKGIGNGKLTACDLPESDDYLVENLQNLFGKTSRSIWTVNISNGGRVFKDLAGRAIAKHMGVATHGENASMAHGFLQHFYPFIQYDQKNLTYKTCLNELNCRSFLPSTGDDIRNVSYPPFITSSWKTISKGKRPFSHIHIDMTQIHKGANTLAQYRKFRMNALGALALGVNEIKLD